MTSRGRTICFPPAQTTKERQNLTRNCTARRPLANKLQQPPKKEMSNGVKWGKEEIGPPHIRKVNRALTLSTSAGERARLLVDILGTSSVQEKSPSGIFVVENRPRRIWITLYFVSFRYVRSIDDVVFLSVVPNNSPSRKTVQSFFFLSHSVKITNKLPVHPF